MIVRIRNIPIGRLTGKLFVDPRTKSIYRVIGMQTIERFEALKIPSGEYLEVEYLKGIIRGAKRMINYEEDQEYFKRTNNPEEINKLLDMARMSDEEKMFL